MIYTKYIQYVYLAFAVFFIYEAVMQFINDDNKYVLSLLFVALAIFLFFFKRRFYNKYKNGQK